MSESLLGIVVFFILSETILRPAMIVNENEDGSKDLNVLFHVGKDASHTGNDAPVATRFQIVEGTGVGQFMREADVDAINTESFEDIPTVVDPEELEAKPEGLPEDEKTDSVEENNTPATAGPTPNTHEMQGVNAERPDSKLSSPAEQAGIGKSAFDSKAPGSM